MSALTRLSLANRALIALISVAAAVFGALAIPSLKQQLIPSLEFPAAFVTAAYPGAAPDVVESQVVAPIEDAVRGVAGVTGITSTSYEGFGTVQVELEYGTDIDQAASRMQTAMARAGLPDGTEPQVLSGSTDDFLPAVVLAASGDDPAAIAQRLDRVVVPDLTSLDGVRQAEVSGAPEKAVTITPTAALTRAGLFPTDLTAALQGAGSAIPAGGVADGDTSLTVQVGGTLTSLDAIRAVPVAPAGGGTPVPLGQVATVTSVDVPPTSITRTDRRVSLGVAVTMTPDGNAVEISHQVADKLGDWQAALGDGAQLTVVFDQAPFIEQSIESLATEGLLGLVMAVLVILAFLMSVRSTLVTAVSIPLSVLVALIVMWADGLSLNILTLGALTIAVGRVVDDSIVVLENIKRHLGYGEDKVRAVYDGAREVSGAITASTLTTVAVFLPIGLVGGVVGELFRPFAITVAVALLASLLVALTIVPVLAFWFLRQPDDGRDPAEVRAEAEEKERRGLLQRVYVPVIRFAVRRRVITVLASLLIFVATLAMTPFLTTNFLDQSGQTTLSITQTLPPGTSLAATDAAATKVEEVLAREQGDDQVTTFQASIGGGAIPGLGGNANSATYQVTVNEDVDVEAVQERLEKDLAAITDAGDISVTGGQSGFGSTDVQVIVQAPDAELLADAAERVRVTMAEVSGVSDVQSDLATQIPRVEVSALPAAAGYGITQQSLGGIVAAAFRGLPAGQVTIDGVRQDVAIAAGRPPATVEQVRALQVPTPAGPVPLTSVASVETVEGPVQIQRIDGARAAIVSGTPDADNLGAASQEVTRALDGIDLPEGASYQLAGATEDQAEAFAQLGLALLAAIVIVFVVMVATFRSLVQPLVLLVSIPFAATGALLLLLVTGTPLGVPALIGMLMLVGIVVTNAIVLIDLVNQYRRDGMPLHEAVVEGGRHRLRPILMTAVATIFALLPMAVGLTGEGGFISQPLAVVVIGGLTSSTLLTLVLVPSLYTTVEGRKERRAGKRAARRRPPEPRPAPEPAPADA